MMISMALAISITLMYSAPLVYAALGGVITQRSGVDNIGIEGMMTFGAFGGAVVGLYTNNAWLGFLAGGLFGAMLGLVHAYVAVTLKGSQTISGIALNIIGLGLSIFFTRSLFNGGAQTDVVSSKIPKLFDVLGIDKSGSRLLQSIDIDMTVIVALVLVIIMHFVLYRTKIGLRIRAVGEHPAAADTMGVNVSLIRYSCVILSGFLAGLGGAAMTLAVISNFTPTVISGQGFIALAAVIFGNWKPIGAAGACLLFGFANALAVLLSGTGFPSALLAMLPYIMTLAVLILFIGRSEPPRANGKPYFKGE